MSLYNFWIMDVSVCGLVMMSAFYGKTTRNETGASSKEITSQENNGKSSHNKDGGNCHKGTVEPWSLPRYIIFILSYFSLMGLTVVVLQYYPSIMVFLQHMAVLCFIFIAFTQWFPGKVGYLVGMSFGALWLFSVKTQFRWLMNNVIIAMFSLLASHVQFRNFTFLQIFLWTAFFYDVCLLAKLSDGAPALFSVGECSSLLCQLFEINNTWELPAVFTVRFGENTTHVFLGTGDIIIGALVSNFAMSFFKCSKCVFGIVLSYGIAIGLLSQVDSNKPYPALVSIVPCCSVALVLCAILCRKTKRLFSMTCIRERDPSNEDVLVI